MKKWIEKEVQLVSVSLDFCRISDVMPILDNLSVISVSQHWSISYHSHYCDFVLNVSVLITPPVPQSSKKSERLRYTNIQIKRTRCAYMITLFALWISLKWVQRKSERSGVQIPDGARDFLFPRTVQTRSGTHPVFYSTSEEVVSGVQRQGQGKEWMEFSSYMLSRRGKGQLCLYSVN